jgi:hypothetical protein
VKVALAVVRQEDSGVVPASPSAGSFLLPQKAIWRKGDRR